MELDRDTIKLLASDTRSEVIKALGKRRKTLSELSKELGLAPATLSEQMEKLEKGGLVKKVDEGRKWKYYELTGKSRSVTKGETPLFLMLAGIAVLLVAGSFFAGQFTASASVGTAAAEGKGQAPVSVFSVECGDSGLRVTNEGPAAFEGVVYDTGGGEKAVALAVGESIELNESAENGTVYAEGAVSASYRCD